MNTFESLISNESTNGASINDEESFNSMNKNTKEANVLSETKNLCSPTDTPEDLTDAKTRSGTTKKSGKILSLTHFLKRGQGATSPAGDSM